MNNNNYTKLELQFIDFLKNNNIKYEWHKDILCDESKNEYIQVSFLLNDYNIAIDIDDIEHHNLFEVSKQYHINKTIKLKKADIKLFHVYEWEFTDNVLWNRVCEWILNACDAHKNKVFARKCNIHLVSLNEEKNFLNSYHLQGYIKSKMCLGLYSDDNLVQLMSFCKSRNNKNYEWELLRLCTKYGYTVIGGANKLLKHFISDYNPKSIISYCSLDKFDGHVYENLGFKTTRRNQPSAVWYNPETGDRFLDRSLLLLGADKLCNVLWGKGTDNEEIVMDLGYWKVYNCGNSVYTMELN